MSAALAPLTGKPINKLTQPLYDSGTVATSATTRISFFTIALNNGTTAFGSGVKTLVDTNLRQASQLPMGWHFDVYAFALAFWSTAATQAADIALCLHNAYLRFIMGGSVEWFLAPAKMVLGGLGVDGFSATTATTTTIQGAHNGVAHPDAIEKLSLPIPIEGGESFEGELVFPAAPTPTAAVAVQLFMRGELLRAS